MTLQPSEHAFSTEFLLYNAQSNKIPAERYACRLALIFPAGLFGCLQGVKEFQPALIAGIAAHSLSAEPFGVLMRSLLAPTFCFGLIGCFCPHIIFNNNGICKKSWTNQAITLISIAGANALSYYQDFQLEKFTWQVIKFLTN